MSHSYRAVKTVRHDGKLYEVGKVYDLPAEIGDAVKALVPTGSDGQEPEPQPQPQVVGPAIMVLVNINGVVDPETLAKLDELIASRDPLDIRVTFDEAAARALAEMRGNQALQAVEVHVVGSTQLMPPMQPAPVAATAEPEGTVALAAGGNEPAPTIAAVNAALVDKDGDGKPDKAKKAKAAKADAPQT